MQMADCPNDAHYCSCCAKVTQLEQQNAFLRTQLNLALAVLKADVSPTIAARPFIGSLPPEILDRIVTYMDSANIMTLCHAVPSLKYISQAIFDVGTAFDMDIEYLFPEFWFPIRFKVNTDIQRGEIPGAPLELVGDDREKVALLARLVTRHGGISKVQAHSVEYTRSVSRLLPSMIDVYMETCDVFGCAENFRGVDSYEAILVAFLETGVGIRRLDIPQVAPGETGYMNRPEFLAIAANVEQLRSFTFFPSIFLLSCPLLVSIEFNCSSFESYSFSMLLELLPNHPSLLRVVFEAMLNSKTLEPALLLIEKLGKVGWNCSRGSGEFFGWNCVVWEKKEVKDANPS
ncbi:hypothetical protein BDR26DRAFT_848774 [Obelidium mucronatum]|nr:hypothetical protein BDR26DRAFT_848774 [Obelidium mucronatum]